MSPRFTAYGFAAIGLGLVALAFRDVPMTPQRLPAILPHAQAGLVCGAALVLAGTASLIARTARLAMIALAAFFALYALVLALPSALKAPLSAGAWLGVAEIGGIAAGGVILLTKLNGNERLGRAARIALGLCALDWGICHFAYPDITASMVPQWLPARTGWAWATGTGHTLAGLALVSGVRSRLAAWTEAAMCAGFVLLVHLPRVAAAPGAQAEWAMLATAAAIAAAALAGSLAPERPSSSWLPAARLRRSFP